MADRRRRLRPRHVVGLLVLAAVVVGCWCAYRALQVRSDLNAAKADATTLQSALDARDVDAAEAALRSLTDHSVAAADGSSGPTWSLLGHAPLVGDDVQAIGSMSEVLADLSGNGLGPLLDVAQAYDEGRFTPKRGRIPVDEVAALQEPVADSRAAFARADERLAELDGSYLGQVEDARTQLTDAVTDGSHTLTQVQRAVDLLPSMLGIDGPRRYLLVIQNNAEPRSTGGFPGSTFVLTADGGRIDLGASDAGRLFTDLAQPVTAVTPAERALFGERVGTRFVDSNAVADFPRAAELMRLMWQQRFGTRLDGVVTADPVLLSYLMRGLPPVESQGVTITADNAVAELLSTPYARWVDPEAQDAFFRDVGVEVFSSLTNAPDPASLVDALQQGADEGRILVVSTHKDEEQILASAGIDGALPKDAGRADVGIYVNDRTGTTGSKLGYYLSAQPSIAATECARGRQQLTGSLDLSSSAPAAGVGLTPYVTGEPSSGQQKGTEGLAIVLVGPRGGTIGQVTVGGRRVVTKVVSYQGRPAVRVELELPAGASTQLGWTMRTGRGQTGPGRLSMTPGVSTPTFPNTFASACADA